MNSMAAVREAEFDPFAEGDFDRVFPTSEAQREVWLADRLSPQASLAFNESVTLRLRGALDVEALQGALKALGLRHEALRCCFGADGNDQFVSRDAGLILQRVDLTRQPEDAREAALRLAAEQAVETVFDLERGPLLRAALYQLAPDDHALLLTAHHIVCDGWSWGVIAMDLGALYAEQIGVAPGPLDCAGYSDYVRWELEQGASEAMREHERYWLHQYRGSLPVLDLPTDRARPAMRGFASRRLDHELDAALLGDLRALAARSGVSLFACLLGSFGLLLSRLGGQDDVVVGVPAAGQASSGLTGLVGHCVNLLPIRLAVDPGQPLSELLKHSSAQLMDGFEHQALTYAALLRHLQVARDPRRLPLVSVMFNLDQPLRGLEQAYPNLRVDLSSNPRHFENFELFVNAVPVGDRLRLECQYNTDLFDEVSVRRWLAAFETLLRAAVGHAQLPLGELAWLNEPAQAELKALQPPPTAVPGAQLMHAGFAQQCLKTPDSVAVLDGAVSLSYQTLDRRANQLARAMRARGVRRGSRVGLCLTRQAEMVVALLAALRAGAAYVPLDPGFPAERLSFYAEDAALDLLVLDDGAASNAPTTWRPDASERLLWLDRPATWSDQVDDPLVPGEDDPGPEDAAYLIYTSGSTGKPKGVAVPHRAVANFLHSMVREPGLAAGDCLAAVTTLSFDIAVLEWLLPLQVGARALIVPREVVMDAFLLNRWLEQHAVTAMQGTPSLWRMLLDTPWRGGRGFKALVGGEAFPLDVAQQLLERAGEVWNLYGPTETTIWSTVWRVDGAALKHRGMSIGRPLDNTEVWVLDARQQPCPVGVPGEIYIGGRGVAIGYVNRPELTQERFLTGGLPAAVAGPLYRTGDRGRWCNDGLLEHQGRLDFQVKVRGYRIELGEIESACEEVSGVAQSVVLAREDSPGDTRLVAYLTLRPGATLDEAALKAHLRGKLPDYMLPQHVVPLPRMPLLPNGKVDRKSLPAPELGGAQETGAPVPARNDTERFILTAMEEVLKLPGLGVQHDFFALGGHSLLAARLTAQINRHFQINLPLSALFEAPNAERLALAVTRLSAAGLPKRQPIVALPGRRTAPLTPMQERIRFVQELHPERVLYNTPSGHRFKGPLDLRAFERALQRIVDRQPALRTRIAPAAQGALQIVEPTLAFRLPLVDLTDVPAAERESVLMQRMQDVVDAPIDIHQGPLFRAVLYRLAADEHALLFMPHHIVWDGWSFDLFYGEMAALYAAFIEGRADPLPPLTVSYGDYAEWYLQWLNGAEAAQQLDYWKQRFARTEAPAVPWTDFPRRAGMSGAGVTEWVQIDAPTTERLRALARKEEVTLNMLAFAVYTAMMSRVIGGASIVMGVPVRGRLMAEVEPVMGFFNNLLPLPMRVDATLSWATYMQQVRATLVEALQHQDIAFERLAMEPEVAALSQKAGLYQALFSYQDARAREWQWGPLTQERIAIFQKGATEDLGLWLMELQDRLVGGFTYNADIYSQATAQALHARFMELLQRLAENPDTDLDHLLGESDTVSGRYLQSRREGGEPPAAQANEPPVASAAQAVIPDEKDANLSLTEAELCQIWSRLLGLPHVGVHDNFFNIGGNSLKAMQLIAEIEQRLVKRVRPAVLLEAPTVRQLATVLDQMAGRNSLVRLRAGAGRPAVFFIHDADGEILLYRNLAYRLDEGHACYALQPHVDENGVVLHTVMSDMVEHYMAKIRSVQPHGPYILAGLCVGGNIAFEIARRLQQEGEAIAMVALFDAADVFAPKIKGLQAQRRLNRVTRLFQDGQGEVALGAVGSALPGLLRKIKGYVGYQVGSRLARLWVQARVRLLRLYLARQWRVPAVLRGLTVREVLSCSELALGHTGKLQGDVWLFRASAGTQDPGDEPFAAFYQDAQFGWDRRITGRVLGCDVPGGHASLLQEPQVEHLAQLMRADIDVALAAKD
ncbi:non-ribosomal peptide synthetase [Ideonella oryzae]|nr:non-ribosomal peptide synthetase [Ideonella oryzae]